MNIVIAGGGIGGLSTALSLHDAGLDQVEIFESAPEPRELGVGINLLPHAVRELTELGLAAELEAVAIPTAELAYFTERGQHIWSEPRGREAGYHWPQYSIHRGQLLGILYRAVCERLGASRVHFGHSLRRFDSQGARRVWAEFERRDGAAQRAEGELLVGADGVHSVVRRALYPDEGPPRWNGVTMWRGVTDGGPFLGGRTMFMAGTFARRVVIYPISRKHERGGRALINWVAEARTQAGGPMPPQEWDHEGRLEDVLDVFSGFQFDWLDVPATIRAADQLLQYPMVDRDPLPRWTFGAVTLLGDAAHPMYPVGSNGASQAILDARVLARELALASGVAEGAAAYEAKRRPATSKIVLLNREVGPEQCMEIVAQRAPRGFTQIEDVISRAELEEISAHYKRAAGFDRDELNARPSLSVAAALRSR